MQDRVAQTHTERLNDRRTDGISPVAPTARLSPLWSLTCFSFTSQTEEMSVQNQDCPTLLDVQPDVPQEGQLGLTGGAYR